MTYGKWSIKTTIWLNAMNEGKIFKSSEIQRLANISRIQLVHWVECGAIIPLEDIRGRGKCRIFNKQNLIEAIICRELKAYTIEVNILFTNFLFIGHDSRQLDNGF